MKEDVSLELCDTNHPLLRVSELHSEASLLFDRLLGLLISPTVSPTVISATLNSLLLLTHTRIQYYEKFINGLATWKDTSSSHLTMSQYKSIERCIKVVLLCILR